MKIRIIKYQFQSKVWKYKGKGGWHFVTLPQILSNKIRKNHGPDEEGWGRLKTKAKIGKSEWNTAIWYDSKQNAYLLPVKSLVRRSEKIETGLTVKVVLFFQDSSNLRNWLPR